MVGIQVIQANCIEAMASLPAHSFDAIITDPPYGQTSLPWDTWVDGWPKVAARLLKPSGSMWVFGTLRMFLKHRDDFKDWKLSQDIVWEKHNGSGLHNDRFRRVHEQAAQFYLGSWHEVYKGRVVTLDAKKRTVRREAKPAHFHGSRGAAIYESQDGGPRIQRSVIYARSQHGRAIHPTQKPEAIIEPLIVNACPEGGSILDPFAGSGSTGFVAQRLKREATLIEASSEYVEVIHRRFRSDLFTADGGTDGGL